MDDSRSLGRHERPCSRVCFTASVRKWLSACRSGGASSLSASTSSGTRSEGYFSLHDPDTPSPNSTQATKGILYLFLEPPPCETVVSVSRMTDVGERMISAAANTLRPLVKRLLARGVPFGHLEARLRELVVEVADALGVQALGERREAQTAQPPATSWLHRLLSEAPPATAGSLRLVVPRSQA